MRIGFQFIVSTPNSCWEELATLLTISVNCLTLQTHGSMVLRVWNRSDFEEPVKGMKFLSVSIEECAKAPRYSRNGLF